MNKVTAIAGVVILELFRRKDFYVVFVLTALVTLVMGSINFFNDDRIVRYLKDVCLLLIWVGSLVIAITTTARQIPSEKENRTMFPLLAKPVTRWHLIAGKFLGCWVASGAALVVFYLFFAVISGAREHHWPLLNYVQALWLHWMLLGVVISLVLLGSLVFSSVSANATISFVVVCGILLLGRHLNKIALSQDEPLRSVVYGIYFAIPHLEWFDVRDLIIFASKLIPWGDMIIATVYAGFFVGIFLVGGWLLFRRKALNA